jgi:hypothetical protein
MAVTVRGKGDKDRETVLPGSIKGTLRNHIESVRKIYDKDRGKRSRGRPTFRCSGTKVAECRKRMGMVLGVPFTQNFG